MLRSGRECSLVFLPLERGGEEGLIGNNCQPPLSPPFQGGEITKTIFTNKSFMDHKPKIHNLVRYKSLRQSLRNQATNAEGFLWSKIKNSFSGYKFRRQHGIGNYIVDFYCPKVSIAIELDGEVHREKYESDIERDKFLNSQGIEVLRYRNEQIMKNVEGVLEDIVEHCKKREKNLLI